MMQQTLLKRDTHFSTYKLAMVRFAFLPFSTRTQTMKIELMCYVSKYQTADVGMYAISPNN
ncbi:hypothetical protein [Shimazuella soli]|uniref:hypothetical protein n=1 Tax=Shimazuella soli TaxID=1892854 RepID=UPI001F0D937E|nr:hypothetical protein [Shimazuella soli]